MEIPVSGRDVEKLSDSCTSITTSSSNSEPPHSKFEQVIQGITSVLSQWGLETNGIVPVPEDERDDSRLYQMFFVWFSANANVLTLAAGTVGPAFYGLGILDSLWIILVVDFVTCAIPAYYAVFGPKLGTRSMVQSRFSWGYYGAIIPSLLNVFSLEGYLILNCIIGGQTLAATSSHLNATLGIVVVSLISFAVRTSPRHFTIGTHVYETVVWIPNVVAFIVMVVVGWKDLVSAPLYSTSPVSVSVIMTFGATLAATNVSWAPLTPDYGVYHDHRASSVRIFLYTYLGFVVSSVPAHVLGAAFTATAYSVPTWQAGLGNGNDIGGLMAAILAPTGRFGKFLLVMLSLTSPSVCAPSMYTLCTSFMTVAPIFARIPRFLIAIASVAILIPVAIVGADKLYATFVDILSLIGYWLAPYCAIVLTEHFVFRKSWSSYHVLDAWNQPRHPNLPRGLASLATFLTCVGIIVVCMEQEWWIGPVARAGTGDVGMLVAFVGGIGVYAFARWGEKRWEECRGFN
ncbi:permease for cytosine/purines, uracil, thiamine, allantoin-domain-containing protein [Sparassis latifolia]